MAFEQLGVVSHFGADLHVAHSLTVVFTAIEDQEPRWTQTGCGHSDRVYASCPEYREEVFEGRARCYR